MSIDPRDFGRLEGKLDGMQNTLENILKGQDEAQKSRASIDGRLGQIEKAQAYSAGKNSVIGSIAGLIGGAIAAAFGKHFA